MNWKSFTIFCVSFLVVFLAETVYVFSCGPEPDPYDYYAGFYNPNIPAKPGFEPFYYAGISQYYGREITEEEINLRDWHAFFSGKATEADIREFVYTYTRPQLSDLYNHIEKNTPLQASDSVTKNSLTRYFISSKDRETLGYLMYAKQCEPHVGGKDNWEAPVRDSATMIKLSRNGVQLYKACKNEQIRERFAFQATRLAHYSRNFEQAIHYFDSLAAPIKSTSHMHYKTLALKAGALMRTGNQVESAYIFSRIFDAAPSLRELAYLNTGWTGAAEEQVMRRCANNDEKATVSAMYGFRHFDYYPDGIRNVYRLAPQSPMLDVLLTREINKLEDGYLYNLLDNQRNGADHSYSMSSISQTETKKIEAFRALVDSLANSGRIKEPALWQISGAYLSFMLRDFPGANKRLDAAKNGLQRTILKDQWEIVRLIVAVSAQPRIDKDFESQLLTSFKWLDSKLDTTARQGDYYDRPTHAEIDREFYFRMYRNLLDYVIATRYLQQGDMARLALIVTKRDAVYASGYHYGAVSAKDFVMDSMQAPQMIQLYNLQQQKKKTPYEEYLCRQFARSEFSLEEAIGVEFTRQHDFANAVIWLSRAGSSRVAGLAFTDQLTDYGYDTTESGITQLDYANIMVELEKKMQRNKATAEDYYKYATGLFSISYYGHAYQLSANYRPSTWWYTPDAERRESLRQYFGCYRAEEYYKKAADKATDREFKARCLFMAARCAQKHLYAEKVEWYDLASTKNPHFPELVRDYRNTAFFKESFDRCSYLRDFVYLQKK